jgi:hypothetical protein
VLSDFVQNIDLDVLKQAVPKRLLEFDMQLNPSNAIPQSFYFQDESQTLYLCQPNYATGADERMFISRYHYDGSYRDRMVLTNTAHGSTFFVTTENGKDFIWVGARKKNKRWYLSKFPYKSNVYANPISADDEGVKSYQTMAQSWASPTAVVDKENDIICLRFISLRANISHIYFRKFSEFIAGRDIILSKFDIKGQDYFPMQGMDICGMNLYWHKGFGGMEDLKKSTTQQQTIYCFDAHGNVSFKKDIERFKIISDHEGNGKKEPEGLQVVPSNGRRNPGIIFGNVVGQNRNRRYILHGLNATADIPKALKVSSSSHWIAPHGITSLKSLVDPGEYFIPRKLREVLTDKPVDFPDDDWRVKVSAGGYHYVIQEITNLSKDAKMEKVVRYCHKGNFIHNEETDRHGWKKG